VPLKLNDGVTIAKESELDHVENTGVSLIRPSLKLMTLLVMAPQLLPFWLAQW